MRKALFLLDAANADWIYGPRERADIARLVDIVAPPQTGKTIQRNQHLLGDVEIIMSGWGMPKLDERFLASAPNLRAVFYGAGTVRGFVTEEAWDRGIVITSAYAANAVPVAEYTLAAILFSLKNVWQTIFATRLNGAYPRRTAGAGGYGSTVGLVSLGMVGRLVAEKLRSFDLRVIAYDPYANAATAKKLGVELVSLETIFSEADVVSLHTPNLPETRGMITGAHFAALKPHATFINTARGAVVRETEMIAALQQRPDLTAVLDVTDPEPPVAGSPLYSMPNVVLTPHIAGSQAAECRRMGRYMVEELQRYLAGEPLKWAIAREQVARLA